MKRKMFIFIMTTLMLSACDTSVSIYTPADTPTYVATSQAAATEEKVFTLPPDLLRNSTYRYSEWGEFQLSEGIFYRTPPTSQESPEAYTTRLQDPVVYGDLNDDGLEDAIVFLTTQNGGSGHFIEMAAVMNLNGSAYNISTVPLGDRIGIESVTIQDGLITLNLVVQGPNDPLGGASQPVIWTYLLLNNQLVKQP